MLERNRYGTLYENNKGDYSIVARLPTPGGDDNQWGDILNEYLEVSLENDGTLKTVDVGHGGTGAVTPAEARDNLELGNSATRDVGTTSDTVAAGNDSRIVNALQNLMTAKGDLIAGAASGTPTRLPAGTDGHVLMYDSAEDLGLKAAAVATGSNASPTRTGLLPNAGTSPQWSRSDHVHETYRTLPSGLLANWVNVPINLPSGLVTSVGDAAAGTSAIGPAKANTYYTVWPMAFTDEFIANIGIRIDVAGSADSVTHIGVWNSADDLGPGTLFASHTVEGTATGYQWSNDVYTFQKNTLYWGAIFCTSSTSTAPRIASGSFPDPVRVYRLNLPTSRPSWGNNFAEINVMWRMSTTSLTDLTSVSIPTGDTLETSRMTRISFRVA